MGGWKDRCARMETTRSDSLATSRHYGGPMVPQRRLFNAPESTVFHASSGRQSATSRVTGKRKLPFLDEWPDRREWKKEGTTQDSEGKRGKSHRSGDLQRFPLFTYALTNILDAALEEEITAIVLKHAPRLRYTVPRVLVWEAIVADCRGRYTCPLAAMSRTSWLCNVASEPRHACHHQLTLTLRHMLLVIRRHWDEGKAFEATRKRDDPSGDESETSGSETTAMLRLPEKEHPSRNEPLLPPYDSLRVRESDFRLPTLWMQSVFASLGESDDGGGGDKDPRSGQWTPLLERPHLSLDGKSKKNDGRSEIAFEAVDEEDSDDKELGDPPTEIQSDAEIDSSPEQDNAGQVEPSICQSTRSFTQPSQKPGTPLSRKTSDPPVSSQEPRILIDRKKDKLLVELFLSTRPFDQRKTLRFKTWRTIIRAVKHPLVHDELGGVERLRLLQQVASDSLHAQHGMLSFSTRKLLNKLRIKRPRVPSRQQLGASPTIGVNRFDGSKSPPAEQTLLLSLQPVPSSCDRLSEQGSLAREVARLEQEHRELRGELKELREELRSQQATKHQETNALLQLMEKDRADHKEAFTAMMQLITRLATPPNN